MESRLALITRGEWNLNGKFPIQSFSLFLKRQKALFILTFARNGLLVSSSRFHRGLVMLQCFLQRPLGKLHYRWATWLGSCQTPLLCWLYILFDNSPTKYKGVFNRCGWCDNLKLNPNMDMCKIKYETNEHECPVYLKSIYICNKLLIYEDKFTLRLRWNVFLLRTIALPSDPSDLLLVCLVLGVVL